MFPKAKDMINNPKKAYPFSWVCSIFKRIISGIPVSFAPKKPRRDDYKTYSLLDNMVQLMK
jgi:hypothetical protein